MARIVLTVVAALLMIAGITIASLDIYTTGFLADHPLVLAASLYPAIELLLSGIAFAALASAIGYLRRMEKHAARTSELLGHFADRQERSESDVRRLTRPPSDHLAEEDDLPRERSVHNRERQRNESQAALVPRARRPAREDIPEEDDVSEADDLTTSGRYE